MDALAEALAVAVHEEMSCWGALADTLNVSQRMSTYLNRLENQNRNSSYTDNTCFFLQDMVGLPEADCDPHFDEVTMVTQISVDFRDF